MDEKPVQCPQVFPSRSRLLYEDFAGPYHIAGVDMATRRIVGVERLELSRQEPTMPSFNLSKTIADQIVHPVLAMASAQMEWECANGVDPVDNHASTDALTSVYDLFSLNQTWTTRLNGVVLDDIAVQPHQAPCTGRW